MNFLVQVYCSRMNVIIKLGGVVNDVLVEKHSICMFYYKTMVCICMHNFKLSKDTLVKLKLHNFIYNTVIQWTINWKIRKRLASVGPEAE